jgi:hypothetical protein
MDLYRPRYQRQPCNRRYIIPSANYIRHALVAGGWLSSLKAFSLLYQGRAQLYKLQIDQPAAKRTADRFGAIGGTKLGENRRDVKFHGLIAYVEARRNRLIRQSLRQQLQNVGFSSGQRLVDPFGVVSSICALTLLIGSANEHNRVRTDD